MSAFSKLTTQDLCFHPPSDDMKSIKSSISTIRDRKYRIY